MIPALAANGMDSLESCTRIGEPASVTARLESERICRGERWAGVSPRRRGRKIPALWRLERKTQRERANSGALSARLDPSDGHCEWALVLEHAVGITGVVSRRRLLRWACRRRICCGGREEILRAAKADLRRRAREYSQHTKEQPTCIEQEAEADASQSLWSVSPVGSLPECALAHAWKRALLFQPPETADAAKPPPASTASPVRRQFVMVVSGKEERSPARAWRQRSHATRRGCIVLTAIRYQRLGR